MLRDAERDDLLIRLDERMEHLLHVVDGNGQPGLIQRVAAIEGARTEAQLSRQEAGAAGARAGRKQSLIITTSLAILAIIAQALGIPLPI